MCSGKGIEGISTTSRGKRGIVVSPTIRLLQISQPSETGETSETGWQVSKKLFSRIFTLLSLVSLDLPTSRLAA
jgi:hypothetical protein